MFELVSADETDCEALSQLINSAYRGETSELGWTTESSLLGGQRTDFEALRDIIRSKDNVILVRKQTGMPIGCVHLEKRIEVCYLGMLTVRPDLQSSGIGKMLLRDAESWAREKWHCGLIEMTVIAQRTELIAWYERRGFKVTDRKEPFPYEDERFGLPKRSDLYFIVLEKVL